MLVGLHEGLDQQAAEAYVVDVRHLAEARQLVDWWHEVEYTHFQTVTNPVY